MGKKVAFLLDSYYPRFSPVAKCACHIACELTALYQILVISMDGGSIQRETENYLGQKLIRISTKRILQRRRFEEKANQSKIAWLLLFLLRLKGYLLAMLTKVNIDDAKVKAYGRTLEYVRPDVVIPVCLPFEAVLAAVNYKRRHREVILIPFLFDRFTYNTSLQRNRLNLYRKRQRHIRLENRMLRYSDQVFAMHQLRDSLKKLDARYQKKISYMEHPLLKEPNPVKESSEVGSNKDESNKDEKIRFLYAGALYRGYRSPFYLLQLFRHLKGDFLLQFFSFGNCEKMIRRYVKKDERICSHGSVDLHELEQHYADADVLISIGNFKSRNLASKIFEYMSMGKPIIHFYANSKDPVLRLLKKYPIKLLIDQRKKNIRAHGKRIEKFCKVNKGAHINFDVVQKLFPEATPKYAARKFVHVINNNKASD